MFLVRLLKLAMSEDCGIIEVYVLKYHPNDSFIKFVERIFYFTQWHFYKISYQELSSIMNYYKKYSTLLIYVRELCSIVGDGLNISYDAWVTDNHNGITWGFCC